MIQRIQSVYLLLVAIILGSTLFIPFGYFSTDEGLTSALFRPVGLAMEHGTYSTWGLFALLSISAILAFATIFLFKRRPLQIRLSIFNSLLMVGYYGVLIFFILKLRSELDASFFMKWTICLPIIAFILNYLAIRGIGRDEVLVRAADRIR